MPGKLLHIFDFDGTLFRSPEPNPKLWTSNLLGKIKSPASQSGLGWYQELITLQAPYVHENPDVSWFNPSMLEKCRETLADPNAITVLLTGRQVVYEERMKQILDGANLKFHHYGLKPGGYIFTMDFKLNFISELRHKYKDELSKIVIYEDRVEHATKFESFLKRLGIDCEVVRVKPNVTYLDREIEIELVKKLIELNAPRMQLVSVPTYTGLILDEKSRENLLSWVAPPPQWVVTAHHMTIALGDQPIPGDQLKLGDKGEIEITHVGFDTRSLAVRVKGMPSTNAIPHVTIAHSPYARPADSNEIREWVPVEELAKHSGVLVQTVYVPFPMVTQSVGVIETTSSTTPETFIPQIPLHTLQTKIPAQARLSGTIHVETMFNYAGAARAEAAYDPFPKGVSVGQLIKKRHPTIQGKAIGGVVSQVRAWSQGRVDIRVEEIEEFINNIDLDSLKL